MHGIIFEYDGNQWPNVDDEGNFITFDSEIDALLAMFDSEKYKKSTMTHVVHFHPETCETISVETYYPNGSKVPDVGGTFSVQSYKEKEIT